MGHVGKFCNDKSVKHSDRKYDRGGKFQDCRIHEFPFKSSIIPSLKGIEILGKKISHFYQ